MLATRQRGRRRSLVWAKGPAGTTAPAPPAPAPSASAGSFPGGLRPQAGSGWSGSPHPFTAEADNRRLRDYEQRVRANYARIVPTLKRISALQHEADFERQAQDIARRELGFELPERILADAWVTQLDLRALYAFCVFRTTRRMADSFYSEDPLCSGEGEGFQRFLMDCGFHSFDVSPCADGRLAHLVSYVLRLPWKAVRRKSYAGALFDVEESLARWTETELRRFREGLPNTADAPTRYLKVLSYHESSGSPDTEGCAAHGSDARRAAREGLKRLEAFREAVENAHCCGASIDLLLLGVDTDTDAIRVHVPDANGDISLERAVSAHEIYAATRGASAMAAEETVVRHVSERLQAQGGAPREGMLRLASRLLLNNLSQIDYVRGLHGERYPDIGHQELFIGVGTGFEEVQLRNLTYFAHMETVEEGAPDLDVGVKIFKGLNVSHRLPIPVVIRFEYDGNVPGARERAAERARRVQEALHDRYEKLAADGLLHTLLTVRDCTGTGGLEVLGCSVLEGLCTGGGH